LIRQEIGGNTIAMSRRALRIRRLIQTTIAPTLARLERKIVRTAPAPGDD
jgi:hypothetical protein